MKCKYCGCTDGNGCMGGCSWIKKDVCSNCVIKVNSCNKEIEAYLDDPNTKEIFITIVEKNKSESRLEIIKLNKKKNITHSKKSERRRR